jgi:RNA polymerase sigma factor for flagellar operon FliA
MKTHNCKPNEYLIRDQVLIDYLPLVVHEARQMAGRLPSSVESDDLVSAGTLGLMNAVERFDPSRDVKFRTYAIFRIRGAMLDFLRSNDVCSRPAREFISTVRRETEKFSKENGRTPSLKELAFILRRSPEYVSKRLGEIPVGQPFELTNSKGEEEYSDERISDLSEFDALSRLEMQDALAEVIRGTLNAREQAVLHLYFWQECGLRDIAKHLNVTESRASQLLTQAKKRIAVRLKRHELFCDAA